MKTPSGMFSLVALVAIAIGLVLAFRLFAISPTPTVAPTDYNYLLQITGEPWPMPVERFNDFAEALSKAKGMKEKGISWHFAPGPNGYVEIPRLDGIAPSPGSPFPREGGGDRTGVHVTQRVTTVNASDFQKILDLFASPTSTPKATPTAPPGK